MHSAGQRVPADRRTKLATVENLDQVKNPKALAATRVIEGSF